MTTPNWLKPGQRIDDRYEVIRPLAVGSSFVVLANHVRTDRQVAVMIVVSADEEERQRFRRAVRSVAHLTSVHTV